ncbi:hypothetical protein Tco_0418447 [Tanacetum coccineum]
MEPEDSLIMGDENLSTIPEKESDKVIKSSVEDLVPILSESEDTSESDSECYLPSYDDFSSIDVPCDNSVNFSNALFDANDDFTSSDDESLLEEDVPKENFKIYLNPLFELDDKYISSDVNPLFNEVLEDIESEDSYVSKLDEPYFLVTSLSKLNKDACFDPGGDFILEEIKACPTSDSIPPGIDDADFDPEGDILLLEKLLNDNPSSPLPPKELNFTELKDTILNLPPVMFLERDPRSLEDEPDKDDLKNIVKVSTPGFKRKLFLQHIEDTIFDPDISASSFYSVEPVAYESPMMIFPFFYFCPKGKGIRGEIAPDYEDSRAGGFVHRSLELQSLACVYM